MDTTVLLLARLQFGITLTYHFWFVALTLGLSILIALMETAYVAGNKPIYKEMARFWGKLFIINYALGVVSGIVQEFQFGMNWSEFCRFTGEVIGVPLTLEALTAFFVEATFIGIWVYGWNVFSKRIHLLSIWLIAVASSYSALWILAANAFMQQPAGYIFRNSRLELSDLSEILTNSYLWYQYAHTVAAGLITAGFFVMAASAYYLLKQRHQAVARKSLRMGLICASLASLLVFFSGHVYTQYLGKVQPMKLAAMEGLWETAQPAPFVVAAVIDEEEQRNSVEISIPGMLSILANNDYHSQVEGMKELQAQFTAVYGKGEYIPAVAVLFWSFRLKVAAGSLLIGLVLAGWWYRRKLDSRVWLLRSFIFSVPLIFFCNAAGWLITEMGRQPWLVYGWQLTRQGISPAVTADELWFSFILLNLIYAGMAAGGLYFMRAVIIAGPGNPDTLA